MNTLTQRTPLERINERILQHYAQHPDLIRSLLEQLGAFKLTMKNGQIRCTCPLHRGNNPQAFAVWFDKGIPYWRCHTDCNTKGALTKLVMRKYNGTFEQATTFLAQKAGIQVTGDMMMVSQSALEEESMEQFKRRMGIGAAKEQPLVFSEEWVKYSTAQLYQPVGQQALNYLTAPQNVKSAGGEKCRGFSHETLKKWEVGYVPASAWTWHDAANNCDRGWFEDRIAIPWRDINGHCIGFGGRRIDGVSFQKYKTLYGTRRNSTLYGLHFPETQAAIIQRRFLIFVEGYTDAWAGHVAGAYNITAFGGTEFTTDQLALVRRYPLDYIVTYFDPDGAGEIAAKTVARQMHAITKVLRAVPPKDVDPGDLLDPQQFWAPITQAKPFTP